MNPRPLTPCRRCKRATSGAYCPTCASIANQADHARRGGSGWATQRSAARIRQRDGDRCAICGTTRGPFDVDHAIPLRDRVPDYDANKRVLCPSCNRGSR